MARPTPTTSMTSPSHSTLHNFHVDVKMFGATGDGTTDDTTAITNAIAAAQPLGVGVLFPSTANSYKITSTIDISAYRGLKLIGGPAGRGTPQAGFPLGVPITAASSVLPMFKWDHSATPNSINLEVDNLSFQGSGCAFKISDGAYVRFRNCSFSVADVASADNTNVLLENHFWAWFENCEFTAPNYTEGAVILRGKEPSIGVDHCYLINFKECRFWYNGVLYKDQNDIAVDAAHAERITFQNCDTENFQSTSALIEFTKTAGTNWGGRYVKWLEMRDIAFYDFTGTPPVVRLGVPNGISNALFENILAPRLIERSNGGVSGTLVVGFQASGANDFPVVDSSAVPVPTYVQKVNSYGGFEIHNATAGSTGLKLWSDGTNNVNLYTSATGRLNTDNQFIATDGVQTKYLSGAGKTTVVDGDFTTAPPNGTLAVHFDSSAVRTYLSVRSNGTWHVMAGPIV